VDKALALDKNISQTFNTRLSEASASSEILNIMLRKVFELKKLPLPLKCCSSIQETKPNVMKIKICPMEIIQLYDIMLVLNPLKLDNAITLPQPAPNACIAMKNVEAVPKDQLFGFGAIYLPSHDKSPGRKRKRTKHTKRRISVQVTM